MTANELADEVENRHQWKLLNHIHWSEQAATMLRQQQNQIAILEQQRDAYKEAHEALLAHNLQKGKLET